MEHQLLGAAGKAITPALSLESIWRERDAFDSPAEHGIRLRHPGLAEAAAFLALPLEDLRLAVTADPRLVGGAVQLPDGDGLAGAAVLRTGMLLIAAWNTTDYGLNISAGIYSHKPPRSRRPPITHDGSPP